MRRVALALALAVAVFFCGALPALAYSNDHGETHFFTDVVVPPGETIDGDLNVLFGKAEIEGHVTGNVNVLGSCTATDAAEIDGKLNCIWNDDQARAFAPWLAGSSGFGALAQQDKKLFVKLASSAIVLLAFLLFPMRMRFALDRVERHAALSAAVGFATFVAAIPVAILLCLTLIGIPLVALEIAALFAGIWIGQGAIALLVGRRLFELVMPRTTPSPLAALVLGLVVVSAAEIVPWVGWAVTALVWLVGLGAAVLAFIRVGGSGFAFERAPWSAPPMNTRPR